MRQIHEEIVRIHRQGGAAALATVIGTLGSTPGKSTMKMLVLEDGRLLGSVGGGCVEAEVVERSRDVMREEQAQRFAVDLNEQQNPETGLVCGGRIEIFIEPIVMPTVYLFGAGHVARAVCAAGAPAGFRFVIVDDRPEYVAAERFPEAAERVAAPFAEAVRNLALGADAYVLVMTRGHRQDLEVLEALARSGARPRFIGMIGSKSKHRTLRRHLPESGPPETGAAAVDPDFMDRVQTPVGLPIGARTAEEIAISVLAELIRVRRLGPSS